MPDGATDDFNKFFPEIDVNDALKRVMNKKKLLWSLLGKFKIKDMVNDLTEAIKTNDYIKTKESAHAIKGAAGNLGCMRMRDIMEEVEARSKERQSCMDLLAKINEATVKTEKAIAELLAMPIEL